MNALTTFWPTPAAPVPMRALRLMDHIPDGHVVHAIADHSGDPLLRKGEIVIVDRRDHNARDGGIFLVERGQRHSIDLRTRDVVSIETREFTSTHGPMMGWWMHPVARLNEDVIAQAHRTGGFYMSDGPYGDVCHVNAVVVGRVVGIYDPAASGSVTP